MIAPLSTVLLLSFLPPGPLDCADRLDRLKELSRGLSRLEPDAAKEAYRQIAALQGEEPAREITAKLARGLRADDLGVRAVVAELLGEDQDPEKAIRALSEALSSSTKYFTTTKSDEVSAGRAFVCTVIRSLGNYRDDRSVDALVSLYRRNKASLHGSVARATMETLGEFGTEAALATLVDHLAILELMQRGKESKFGRKVHGYFVTAADEAGLTGVPDYDPSRSSRDLRSWLKKHRRALPQKLGKLKLQSKS